MGRRYLSGWGIRFNLPYCERTSKMEAYQKRIIELFIEQELLLAELYKRFSVSFPEYSEFWLKMVSEEKEHANWLKNLLKGAAVQKVFFSEGKTRTYTVKTYIEYIKKTISDFDKKKPDIIKAMAISRDIETSLIEKNMFKCFDGDSPEVNKVLSILQKAQCLHCKKINDEIANVKKI